jgi:LPXTG-motif cell wall-anchored protein
MKKTLQTMILGLSALAVITILQTVPAHAASLTVATGADENTDNASCSLSEAIENINDQAPTNTDCPAGDGANDTIDIPVGTITLVADLVPLIEPSTVKGAGMGNSIISGDSQYLGLSSQLADNELFTVKDLTMIAPYEYAVSSLSGKLLAERVEVDGAGAVANNGTLVGILSTRRIASGRDIDTTVLDSYLHDMIAADSGLGVNGIAFQVSGGTETNFTINRTTISEIQSTTGNAYGVGYIAGFFGDSTPNNLQGNIQNLTINRIISANNGIAGGIVTNSASESGTATTDINITNSTFAGIRSGAVLTFDGGGIVIAGAADVNDTSTTTVHATNLLMTDNKKLDGSLNNCASFDSSAFAGLSGGTIVNTFTSSGGNVLDDTSCVSSFNKSTDQNSLIGLNSTLGSLQNNGGLVPTRALLQGSPAIDAGVTVAGLTADARGSVRPQGSAYDSGAYESPFTTATATSTATANTASLASTGQSQTIFIALTGLMLTTSLGAVIFAKRQQV